MSVLLFIFLPVAAGALTRKLLIPRKGIEWFNNVYREKVGKISFIALLLTLIVLFSFQGKIILNDPLLVLFIAVPNLIHYAIMITWTYSLGWYLGWKYETAIDVHVDRFQQPLRGRHRRRDDALRHRQRRGSSDGHRATI